MRRLKSALLVMLFFSIGLSKAQEEPSRLSMLKGLYLGQKLPGMTPLRFKPEGFKKGQYAEPAFLFSSGGRECLFTTSGGLYFTKLKNGKLTDPIYTNTYGEYADYEPNISPDGKKIVFNSLDRPLPQGVVKSPDAIWMSERNNGGWSESMYSGLSGMYATLSENGDIYFTKRKDGVDCIAMRRSVRGEYRDIEIIPAPVFSSAYHDQHPCIAPDGSHLIFDSENRPKKNRCGLFVSFKKSDGTWTSPENLGDFIMQDNAAMARITSDGEYLFFNDRNGDNWWVSTDIMDKLKKIHVEKPNH